MNLQNLPIPEAVCFDLDNTLYPYAPCNQAGMTAVYAKLEKLFNIKEHKASTFFHEARTQVHNQLGAIASSHSRLLYFQRMLENMGLNAQALLALDLEQTFWRAYLHEAELFEGVKDLFYALRSKNIAIAIVTDMTAQVQLRKIIHFNLDGLVDHIITSEEAGADKPDPRIFMLTLKKLDCAPERVWMIGDNKAKDIAGAEACGMVGLWKSAKSINDNMSFSSFNSPLFKMFY